MRSPLPVNKQVQSTSAVAQRQHHCSFSNSGNAFQTASHQDSEGRKRQQEIPVVWEHDDQQRKNHGDPQNDKAIGLISMPDGVQAPQKKQWGVIDPYSGWQSGRQRFEQELLAYIGPYDNRGIRRKCLYLFYEHAKAIGVH